MSFLNSKDEVLRLTRPRRRFRSERYQGKRPQPQAGSPSPPSCSLERELYLLDRQFPLCGGDGRFQQAAPLVLVGKMSSADLAAQLDKDKAHKALPSGPAPSAGPDGKDRLIRGLRRGRDWRIGDGKAFQWGVAAVEGKGGILSVLPAAVILLTIRAYPMLATIYRSFTTGTACTGAIGSAEELCQHLHQQPLLTLLRNNLLLLLSVPLQVVIGT